jgi:hypothetical protein
MRPVGPLPGTGCVYGLGMTEADRAAVTAFARWLWAHRVVCPAEIEPRDCVCAVDLPDGAHVEFPERPEVLAARTLPERHVTVVAYLDRDAEVLPEGARVTVVRGLRQGVAA